jgi:hypothetical protein
MIQFLLDDEKFDGERIIDVLIERINSPDSRVSDKLLTLLYLNWVLFNNVS